MKKFYALAVVLAMGTVAVARLQIISQYFSLCFSQGYALLVAAPDYFSGISIIVPGLF